MTTRPDTLGAVPGQQAARQPDHLAIISEGTELTYRDLHLNSNRTAHALHAAGVGRGARVAHLGLESAAYYEIAFGCAKIGAVLTPVNWRLTPGEVADLLGDADAELVFVRQDYLAIVEGLRDRLPRLRTVVAMDTPQRPGSGYRAWRDGHPDTDPDVPVDPADPVAQIYTSGTTGRPKGVVLPHRSFFALGRAMAERDLDWVDWKPSDRSLIALPAFHIAGLSWAMQGFTAGVTNVVMPMFVSSDAVRLIRDLGVTTTFVAPAMLQMMLAEPGSRSAFDSLRKVVYGGSPIAEALLRRCLEVIPADFVQAYAATETGNAVALLPPEDHVPGSPRLRAAGRACPGVEIRLVDPAGQEVAPGQVGEVCVRSAALMSGYWKRPAETANALTDGWLRMGDAGWQDAEGYLYLCDRVKDTIIVAGENVYPAEVENALVQHVDVSEAAVVGAPHERWGESVHACVVLRPGAQVSPRQLMMSLKGRVADYKIPTSYAFLDSLPRNPTGKILRRELRDDLWRGRETGIH
ncbi:Acyl-CoA synthetase (AMP-forming)/AMP-acid ligase II [Micromonospora matsumotoense]|uniref:Acyl-CoA synthetase (AMP-forming)/AMP-acid ligase II n=1 Tax=Micromonospora matsumotoense TaxID=121616 RepID=A0A1C5AXB3_9ACTN|nr:fatty acid--CoA ligase [Micromonospora matsumotoense]SCF49684.1 Acyl-CoA synthetase (AMP-forming)/AMP-acid ligase II [Micromonospora matsumotoense]